MSTERHRVQRQTIELRVPTAALGKELQARLSVLQRRQIAGVVAQTCSELGSDTRLHRLDVLEVELGAIDAADFERSFIARLRIALRAALAPRIRALDERASPGALDPHLAAQRELLERFARGGALPWWADAREPDLLATCVRELLAGAPRELAGLVRSLVREPRALQRLVGHLDDGLLAELAGLLGRAPAPAAALATFAPALAALVDATGTLPQLPTRQARAVLWRHALRAAAEGGAQGLDLAAVASGAFLELAARGGVTTASLVTALAERAPAAETPLSDDLRNAIEAARHEVAGSRTLEGPRAAAPSNAGSGALLALMERGDGGPALRELARALHAWLDGRREAEQAGQASPAGRAGQPPAAEIGSRAKAWNQRSPLHTVQSRPPSSDAPLAHVLAALLSEARVARSLLERALADLRGAAGARLAPGAKTALGTALSRALEPAHGARTRSRHRHDDTDIDALYVDNAGLVLLWPYLARFFGRLGLVQDKRFTDPAAAQRAVGLLQVLAAGDPEPPEFMLPLNKVLCGVPVDEVFDFGPPLTDDEEAECTGLLTAAIEQAPILRNMSLSGFRGTFLLRAGALSTRDGAWLLRVERQTYDLVLDRFPWAWTWVKLPWMRAPLRVEW